MKNMIYSTLLILSYLTAIPSQAQNSEVVPGHHTGSGGDSRCADYSDTVSNLASTLFNIGQERMNQINKLVDVTLLWNLSRELKCIPQANLDRDARTDPATKTTYLKTDRWEQLGLLQKARLATHELAVLANLEREGEYRISDAVLNLARTHSLMNYLKSKKYILNADESITFIEPGYMDLASEEADWYQIDKDSPVEGVCKYLGYRFALDMKSKSHSTHVTRPPTAIINELGHLVSIRKHISIDTSHSTIDLLTCTNRLIK